MTKNYTMNTGIVAVLFSLNHNPEPPIVRCRFAGLEEPIQFLGSEVGVVF